MKLPPGSISISFLDLLSGALAGVIILFIIVPKGNTFTNGDLQEQKISIDSLFIVIDSLYLGKDTLTTLDIQLLDERLSKLRAKVDSITTSGAQLQRKLIARKAKQVVLEDSLRSLRSELRAARLQSQQRRAQVPRSEPVARTTTRPQPLTTASTSTPQRETSKKLVVEKPTAIAQSTAQADPTNTQPREEVRDPLPNMLDPFMVDVRWVGRSDVDLLLLSKAGTVLCNDSRCNKKFAGLERSGKKDTTQYERMRVVSREPAEYDVRLAIHSGFGKRKGDEVTVTGDYYIKQSAKAAAIKQNFKKQIKPRQRGENGAPGISIGKLTIQQDGAVVFKANPS